ncbi:restriction endonuclease subunit S [Methanomicrobium antiquum]|uniref:Restriction endonuclease subunit S n=1 Tax=Methanomicrobium antiquum TaxID=487686 RepID=A0AAF0FQ71_9EURY|nr:restriction endonuclease subunit S [Methanomicrobium antiquum]WFN35901.1 restriction endonuclease subunit S [Methanomicrobium antiquum]
MRAMKDSGIEWIGEIPVGWEIRRLRFLCQIITGDKDTINKKEDGLYPFYVRSPNIERIDSYTFDGEAILMAGDGVGAGKVFHYVNGKFDYHQRVYNLHFFKDISGKYLYYYLKENFWKKIEESNAKSTVDSVRLPMLLDFPVALGELPEQTRIASFLDNKCTAIDASIEKQRASIDKLKEYRQVVITNAVTKGLNPDVPMKDSGVEWIGEIPEGWDVVKLKWLARMKSGESITSNIIDNDSTYPVYGGNGLRGYAKSFTHNGSYILIGRQGALCGNVHIVKGNFWASEHAIVTYELITLDQKWLFYILSAMNLNQYSTSAAQPGLAVEQIQRLSTLLPPISEQHEIAAYLDQKCTAIDEAVSKKETLIKKLEEYKKSLIYEAVTGKIEIPELSA